MGVGMKQTTLTAIFAVLSFLSVPAHAGSVFPPEGACSDGDVLVYKQDSDGGNKHVICRPYPASTIPTGTVAAFNLAACPSGWIPAPYMSGRTAVGAGSGAGLTARAFGATGGEETHVQTLNELPSHSHYFGTYCSNEGTSHGFEAPTSYYPWVSCGGQWVSSSGLGQAFNVMMPWVALTYCQKT